MLHSHLYCCDTVRCRPVQALGRCLHRVPARALPGLEVPHKHELHGLPERADDFIDGRHEFFRVSDSARYRSSRQGCATCYRGGWLRVARVVDRCHEPVCGGVERLWSRLAWHQVFGLEWPRLRGELLLYGCTRTRY